jgi:nicotinamide-nucleotide amidase
VENEVVPRLLAHLGAERTTIRSQTIRVVGMGESEVETRVKDLMEASDVTVAPYAKLAEVHLRVTARRATDALADDAIGPVVAEIRSRLGDVVYGLGDDPLEKVVVDALVARGETVATAESCTGGTLAGRITAVSGSSTAFGTGVVSYANDAKAKLLEIDPELISRVGAVSEEVAGEMARGVRAISGADFGVGITGIAGPGGGSETKPVGLVYIGVASAAGVDVRECHFPGGRDDVRFRSTQVALDELRRALLARVGA